jgi:RHS repeat-associated protein
MKNITAIRFPKFSGTLITIFAILFLCPMANKLCAQVCSNPSPNGANTTVSGTTVTFKATNQGLSSGITSVTHNWYTAATNGTWIATTTATQVQPQVWTSSYSETLTSSKTYYVSTTTSACNIESSRTAVSYTYTPPAPCGTITIGTTDPQSPYSSIPPAICAGDQIRLVPQGGTSYSWSSSPSDPSVSGSGIIVVSPTQNTTYTLTGYVLACGGNLTTSVLVTVAPKVGQVSISSGPGAVCQGTAFSTYTGSASNNPSNNYQWQLLDPATNAPISTAGNMSPSVVSGVANGTLNWNSSFTATVRVKLIANSSGGCNYSTSDYRDVTVSPLPGAPTVSNVPAAYGSVVTLTATGAASGESYKWHSSPGGTVVSNTITTAALSNVSTTYYVSRYNIANPACETPSGQQPAQTLTLYLDAPPAPTPSSNTCGSRTVSWPAPLPGVTYYWQGTSATQSTSTPLGPSTGPTYTLPGSATYYVQGKVNSMPLWSSATGFNFPVINPAPPATPSVSGNSCGVKTLTRGNPSDGSIWYWQGNSPGGQDQSATAAATTYTASVPGVSIYYLRALLSGCWSTATAVTVTVNNPPPPATPVVSTVTCGPKILTKGTPPPGVDWYWQSSPSGQDNVTGFATSAVLTVTNSGTYYLAARDAANCWSYKMIPVYIDPVDIEVTSYDPAIPLVQATHSIKLSPGFIVPSGSTFNARIAISPECNDYYNWTESIAYDQNAQPLSRTRSYVNGLGNLLQSQAIDYRSGKVWASQPLYDYFNKPAASTLPAPILENDFIYKPKFVLNATGDVYSAYDFDGPEDDPIINNPNPVGSQPGTVGWYYSTNNNIEPLTPVTSYPYSRAYTLEGPDPSTSKSAGVGDQNRMGSGHEMSSDRQVFVAGELAHYLSLRSYFVTSSIPITGHKYISTDPDGKMAISFVDADGRNLATGTITSGGVIDNWSYSYYNDLGQLAASVAPKGVNIGSNSMPSFVTLYKYDHLGRHIETTSSDEGTSRFVYSTDGKIRFSESQEQRNATPKRFAYTNYDYLGRLVESGEYSSTTGGYIFEPHTTTSPASMSVLNIVDNVIGLGVDIENLTSANYTGTSAKLDATRCSDYSYIKYDQQANDFPSAAAPFDVQNNTPGQITKTENANAKTYYSYDEFGNLEWTKQRIINAGIYKTINYTYDYFGNVTLVAYQAEQSDAFYHHYEYDIDQRLTKVYTSKDGVNKTIRGSYSYYLHGPLKRMELGGDKQGIDYVYTIDGALKSINHADPTKDPGQDGLSGANASIAKDAFGMTLHYNGSDYTGAGQTMGSLSIATNPGNYPDSYSGLVKAISYNSPVDNNQKRVYAYQYDALNQLKDAQWGNVTGSSASTATLGENYRERMPNGYDNNGNIASLERKDGSGTIQENFTYNYETGTNRLDNITTGISGPIQIDYSYNTVGQLTQQSESGNVMKMSYNAHGLVKDVRNGSDVLLQTYAYDDRGNLLEKTSYTSGVAKKNIFYVRDASGNVMAIYEQTIGQDVSPILTEVPLYGAGRIGVYKPGSPAYLYEVDDHLGNVRAVIDAPETIEVTATMETANKNDEQVQFLRYDNVRKVNAPLFNHTLGVGSSMSVRLSGTADEKIGLARSLYVSPGDVVDLTVYAKYADPVESNWSAALTGLISSVRAAAGGTVVDGAGYSANHSYSFPYTGLLTQTSGTGPKAYLNYLFFNASFQFQLAKSGFVAVTDAAKTNGVTGNHEQLHSQLNITEPGYLYVYLSNESPTPIEVYFDDFDVKHTHSTVVGGADYYPYGLVMKNREIIDEPYRYGYQGQFSEKDLTTGWSEFELRMYDSRIGRWTGPDPYGQYASAYSGMGNTPNMSIDPDGGFNFGATAVGAAAGFGAGSLFGLIVDHDSWWKYGIAGAVAGGVSGALSGDIAFQEHDATALDKFRSEINVAITGKGGSLNHTGGRYVHYGPGVKSVITISDVEWQILAKSTLSYGQGIAVAKQRGLSPSDKHEVEIINKGPRVSTVINRPDGTPIQRWQPPLEDPPTSGRTKLPIGSTGFDVTLDNMIFNYSDGQLHKGASLGMSQLWLWAKDPVTTSKSFSRKFIEIKVRSIHKKTKRGVLFGRWRK